MQKTDLICHGRCDGMAELNPMGSYVRLTYSDGNAVHGIVISEGCAETLVAELRGALAQKTAARLAEIAKNTISPKPAN